MAALRSPMLRLFQHSTAPVPFPAASVTGAMSSVFHHSAVFARFLALARPQPHFLRRLSLLPSASLAHRLAHSLSRDAGRVILSDGRRMPHGVACGLARSVCRRCSRNVVIHGRRGLVQDAGMRGPQPPAVYDPSMLRTIVGKMHTGECMWARGREREREQDGEREENEPRVTEPVSAGSNVRKSVQRSVQ